MKREYEYSKGKRGAVIPTVGKTAITIKLDNDVLDWFRSEVPGAEGGNYQTLINTILREYVSQQKEPLEDILRRMVREELCHIA
jgi:uncharacterized protein (DUF4415 family)